MGGFLKELTKLNLIGLTIWFLVYVLPSRGGNLFLNMGALIILLFSARICYYWSKKIKANRTLAYLIGISFGLFGLLGYFIYYRIKLKNVKTTNQTKK